MKRYHYTTVHYPLRTLPNQWDALFLLGLFGFVYLVAWGIDGIDRPYALGETLRIDRSVTALPHYAVRTAIRMGVALGCSLIFSLIVGSWAAKSARAEKIIIPLIDILQSVPILGFLSFTLVGFIQLFPHSLWGPECAAIFLIFTSQVWNITLSFYQSLKTVPAELLEAAQIFHLSRWQRFWRIEVPYAMPGLIWNMMVSVSAGWFFIIFSEAIDVADQHIDLPGIGSYLAEAIRHADTQSLLYGIIAMFAVILSYDQLLFRPLVSWSARFEHQELGENFPQQPWLLLLLKRTRWVQACSYASAYVAYWWVNWRASPFLTWLPQSQRYYVPSKGLLRVLEPLTQAHQRSPWMRTWHTVKTLGIILGTLFIAQQCIAYIPTALSALSAVHPITIRAEDMLHALFLGAYTLLRIVVLLILCSFIWVPVGVWLGLRPRFSAYAQPIAQFLAAIPANLFYPLAVMGIMQWHLDPEIWISPLMILGTQWYILFNVIAGASQIPADVLQAAENLQVRGWLWWKRLAFPAILPYYVTGAMAAAGGAWNSSIAAEIVRWGDVTVRATGLGAYIHDATTHGWFGELTVGIVVMSVYVILCNRLFWKPLFQRACTRFGF